MGQAVPVQKKQIVWLLSVTAIFINVNQKDGVTKTYLA